MSSSPYSDAPLLAPHLAALLAQAEGDEELFHAVVNAPFEDKVTAAQLFLGVVVLLLVNPQTQTIDRIAISNTEIADRTKQGSVKRFEDIRIPVGYKGNIIAQAVATGEPQEATDWKYLFAPELSAQNARFNQADGGIAFSCVHPFSARDGGAMIFSYFQPKELIEADFRGFMQQYIKLVNAALARS